MSETLKYHVKFILTEGQEVSGDMAIVDDLEKFMDCESGTFTFIEPVRTQIIDRRFVKVIEYYENK